MREGLPDIRSPREERKKLKIRLPLSLKNRHQQRAKQMSEDPHSTSKSRRKLYNNVEARIF